MEKISFIPKDCMGLVIGRRGTTLQRISSETGAFLEVKDREIYIAGKPEDQAKALTQIRQIIKSRNRSPSKEGKEKLTFIPQDLMGLVIGTGGSTLRQIRSDTDATLDCIDGAIYVSGSVESRVKARLSIKQIIMNARAGYGSGRRVKRLFFIESSCVGKDAEFKLEPVPLPNPTWHGNYYRIKLDEESKSQRLCDDESELKELQTELLSILKDLHETRDMEVDIWCHFGRVYLKDVDEEDEGELFTANEIKSKLKLENRNQPSPETQPLWKTNFKEGITELEIQNLEESLKENVGLNTKEDRQDFDFITPTCEKIHSKVWLVRTDKGGMSYVLCPPRVVRNQLGRVMSEELGSTNTSKDPSFYLCATYNTVMTADVILPGHRFDCRIIIRQCKKKADDSQDIQAKQEVEEISDYLRNMHIDDKGIVLPQEIPEGYELDYRRRSRRQTYYYPNDSNGVPCRLCVCKEEFKEGVAGEKSDPESHVDIHLRCDEWDKAFEEGQWEPEQIVGKLPQFLHFVREVQNNLQLLDHD